MSVAKKLASLISEGSQSKTSPYDTTEIGRASCRERVSNPV